MCLSQYLSATTVYITIMSAPSPSIVFVPGAWHDAPCFDSIRQSLKSKGWPSEASQYPSVGAEPPNKGLSDDVEASRSILERLANEKEVVLVAHSYGGPVAANTAEGYARGQRRRGGIVLFVYLAVFVVPTGLSVFDMIGGQWLPWMKVQAGTPNKIIGLVYSTDTSRRTTVYWWISPNKLSVMTLGRACRGKLLLKSSINRNRQVCPRTNSSTTLKMTGFPRPRKI